jgi:Yersinia/Haemophilus virulence surface antigen
MPHPSAAYAQHFYSVSGEEFGGTTKDFQQGNPESYGWINLDPKTRHGACYALSVWWMLYHRNGKDFFAWVKGVGGIKTINNTFTASIAAANQDDYMNDLLVREGLARRQNGDSRIKPVNADQAAINIVSTPGYKNIGILGTGGGHAIAAVVTGTEARFYDPNYGEVAFKSAVNLAYWFKTWWVGNKFYNQQLGGTFEIYAFA